MVVLVIPVSMLNLDSNNILSFEEAFHESLIL